MEITPMGQIFYRREANGAVPRGCSCHDKSGSCEWCQVYYNGPANTDYYPEIVLLTPLFVEFGKESYFCSDGAIKLLRVERFAAALLEKEFSHV